MKFLAVTIFQFVSGSLYTDENLYHEDKADGKQAIPDVSLVRTVVVNFSISEAIRRIYEETTPHQVYGYDIPPDQLSINELE